MPATSFPARFEVRPIGPADRDALVRFYAGLSSASREGRFHGAAPAVAGTTAGFFCGPDHCEREGIVAEATTRDGRREIIGHLSLEPGGPGAAELAVVVADAWQRHGVGRALIRAAVEWARRRGVTRLVASMRTSNAAIARLVRSVGVPVRFGMPDGGVLDAVMELETTLPRAA